MNRLILITVALLATSAYSYDPDEVPHQIDFDLRESENYRIELAPHGGQYFGDKLHHSFEVGQTLQFNLIPALGVEGTFGWSKATFDPTSPLGQTISDRNLYIMSGGLVATKPAAYRGRKGTVEFDLYSGLGGGTVRLNDLSHGMGYIAVGMKTRFRKVLWLAWRLDVRNYFYGIPNPGGSDFSSDLTLTVGPTFMLWPVP